MVVSHPTFEEILCGSHEFWVWLETFLFTDKWQALPFIWNGQGAAGLVKKCRMLKTEACPFIGIMDN